MFDSAAGATRRLGAQCPKPSICELLLLPLGLILIYVYVWILDDAFVYFRYADNALLGNGLVYNKGEYVEGFTSPLWMLLVLVARAVGLSCPTTVLASGLVLYTVFWGLMVLVNRPLSPEGTPILNAPLLLAATGLATTTWFTSGMETSLMMVFAPLAALFVLNPLNRPLQAVVGLLVLVRPEYALVMAVAALWAWRRGGRFPWFLACAWSAIAVPWMLFRIYYYADLFPNTFYLKDGTDILRGLRYLYDGAHAYHLIPIGAVLAGLLLFYGRNTSGSSLRMKERGIMLLMAVASTLYAIKVGGDTWHFRQLLFPYILCLCALSGAAESGLALFDPPWRRWACAIAAVFLLQLSLDSYPNQLNRHPLCIKWEWRHTPEIRLLGEKHTSLYGQKSAFPHLMANGIECPPFGTARNLFYDCSAFSASVPGDAPRSATSAAPYENVISDGWCYSAWVQMGTYISQGFGLTNPILARTDVPSDLPGHKLGLAPLCNDIRDLTLRNGGTWSSGMYERAVAEGTAPEWIRKNIQPIGLLEKKALNRHNFFENLFLALRRVPTIHIDAKPSDPDHDPVLQRNLGLALAELGRPDEALQHYRESLRIDPDNFATLNNCANVLVVRGALDEAEQLYRRMIALDPGQPQAYYNLACLYARQGRKEQAFPLLKKAVEMNGALGAEARKDPDFAALREDPEFAKIVGAATPPLKQ